MKFTVSSSALLKQLTGIVGVISPSNALPILDCFLFQVDKKQLKLCASDLETTVTTSMEIISDDTFDIAIPSQIILDALKTYPETPLVFDIDTAKKSIILSSDYGKYKLTGHDAQDFPRPIKIESPSTFEMEEKVLAKAINKTLFAVGADELRPAMCGVFIKLDTDGLTFVSTDTHKFSKYKRGETQSAKMSSYIIPKKPLGLLKNVLTSDGNVKVQYNNSNVSFTSKGTQIVSRLIDQKYPNYDAVIPKNNPNLLTIGREEFLNSIKRVSVFSNKNTNQVNLNITPKQMVITGEDLDYSNEATETIKCDYKGADLKIGFSSKILCELLSNIETQEVLFELGTATTGAVLRPVGNTIKEEDVLMLIMPMMTLA